MARYRPVHISIWEDEDRFLEYNDAEKVLFLYLITNGNCTESGIYKISLRTVAAVLDWNREKVVKTLNKLSPNVYYDSKNSVIFIKNFLKYNGKKQGRPDLIQKSIEKDMEINTSLWSLFIKSYPKFEKSLNKVCSNFDKSIFEYEYEYDIEYKSEYNNKNNVINDSDIVNAVNKKSIEKKQRNIIPPKIEWVKEYIEQKEYPIDANKWFNFYNAKGWMINKNKMKDWHSAIGTWLPDGYKQKKKVELSEKDKQNISEHKKFMKEYENGNEQVNIDLDKITSEIGKEI